ncbi:MAG: hypothetical protein HC938_01235 [Nitrospira sp.]|nr:hypothetical protein [Nitrospira sp.]
MPIEVPSKLYIDKLLKDCRTSSLRVARLASLVKTTALQAMADRVAAEAVAVLTANTKDVDAIGKALDSADARNRMKATVARVRLTGDHIKEIADRLRLIADLRILLDGDCSARATGWAASIQSEGSHWSHRGNF